MLIETVSLVTGLVAFGQMGPLPHVGSLTDGLRGPARIAIASDNTLFVSDPLNSCVAQFEASGELIATWPIPAVPIGVAVHPDGRIFVSLRDEAKVAVYRETFTFLEYLGENEPGVAFAGPTDIEIAPDSGRIYVVDADADQIYGFNSDGTLALTLVPVSVRGSPPVDRHPHGRLDATRTGPDRRFSRTNLCHRRPDGDRPSLR